MSSRTLLLPLLVVLAMCAPDGLAAQLRASRLVGDGMVIQRDAAVPIRGWAAPGAAVEVGFHGATYHARADREGRWQVTLGPLPAGGPHELSISSGAERLHVRDVLVGDVWVASGQSNMEWPVADSDDAAAEIAAAGDRRIRHFKVPQSHAEQPAADLAGGVWEAAEPRTVGAFSAVGYYFARELRRAADVPIGIVNTTWGGSNIETWMSREMLGMSDAEWTALMERERAQAAAAREALRARIGGLPTADAGLVDGRAVWADPALDDSGWDALPVPSLWEQAGYAGLDGIAWYRTTFSLSEAEARRGVVLSLGMIDDDDITWVNGVEVGRTEGYAERRHYAVPASALRLGTNVLAVRVADGAGGGGPHGDASHFYLEIGSERRPLAGRWKFRVGAVSFQADGQQVNKVPTVLYNRMVHPLLGYPIKGVIWYQGESNANGDEQAAAYRGLFADMIAGWRRAWGVGDFPFLFVQLANFMAPDAEPAARSAWATLREAQTAALRLPNTAQAVAIDIGEAGDIHPRNKQEVGRRLALAARRVAYGEDVVHSGPVYRRHQVQGDRVVIDFDHAGGGLTTRREDGTVGGFAIAGADGQWHWADARIEGNRVVVGSDRVPGPVAVRYAWGNNPENASLYNREGLPATPFRTDAW